TMLVQFRSWQQLAEKDVALVKAREEVTVRQQQLVREHEALARERAGQTSKEAQGGTAAPSADITAGHTSTPMSKQRDVYSALKQAAEERKHLAELDKRSADL